MRIAGGLWRSGAPPNLKRLVLAALAAAVIPVALGYLVVLAVPHGCHVRGAASLYRWSCMLPIFLFSIPVVAGVLLPLAALLNARLGRPVPDGVLPTALLTGVIAHLVLILAYFLLLNPAYRDRFLWESLAIPQPFLAGAISGAVFSLALSFQNRRSSQASRSSRK